MATTTFEGQGDPGPGLVTWTWAELKEELALQRDICAIGSARERREAAKLVKALCAEFTRRGTEIPRTNG